MASASTLLGALRTNARACNTTFEALLEPTAELKAQLKQFESATKQYGRTITSMQRSIGAVTSSTTAYLAAYARVREEIRNTDLRAAMLMRRESIEKQLGDMQVGLADLLTSCETLTRELKDLELFLSANLNPQGVAQSAVVGEAIRTAIAGIENSADRVSLELKDLGASLATERAAEASTPAPL